MEKMYSTIDASKVLGVKLRTVRWMISNGRINAVKYSSSNRGKWYIPESEIKRMTQQEVTARG